MTTTSAAGKVQKLIRNEELWNVTPSFMGPDSIGCFDQQLRTSPSTQREQVAKSVLGEWGIKSLAAFVQSAPNPTLLNDAAAV